jgi:hypothetical protein
MASCTGRVATDLVRDRKPGFGVSGPERRAGRGGAGAATGSGQARAAPQPARRSTSPSISTGIPKGNSAMPTALRA